MIICVTGKNGMGKSYWLAQMALWHYRQGANIFHNFPYLNFDKVKGVKTPGKLIYWQNASEWYNAENGIIIADELQMIMNSRKWYSLPEELQYKLQQHRKDGLDIYGASQSVKRVDTVFRELVQKIYSIQCFGFFKEKDFDKRYPRYRLNLFVEREYDPDYIGTAQSLPISSHWFRGRQEIYGSFETNRKITSKQ
jgi:hypothetical protein